VEGRGVGRCVVLLHLQPVHNREWERWGMGCAEERCHRLPLKWTDSAVMTTLSAYISHGHSPEYCCSTDSHAVECLIVL
jgi:hypothetical protein